MVILGSGDGGFFFLPSSGYFLKFPCPRLFHPRWISRTDLWSLGTVYTLWFGAITKCWIQYSWKGKTLLLLIHGLSQELEISGDGGDRRILWGLKFSIPGFFGRRKIWGYGRNRVSFARDGQSMVSCTRKIKIVQINAFSVVLFLWMTKCKSGRLRLTNPWPPISDASAGQPPVEGRNWIVTKFHWDKCKNVYRLMVSKCFQI